MVAVRVTYGARSVVVRINDRGPFLHERIIDLAPASPAAEPDHPVEIDADLACDPPAELGELLKRSLDYAGKTIKAAGIEPE